MNVQVLVKEAERLLKQNPRNEFNDLSHHRRVWNNVQELVKSIDEKVDMNALRVAAMWHDVMISRESISLGSQGVLDETVDHLEKFMFQHKYNQEFIDLVLDVIRYHNFNDEKQKSMESKILFDADKWDVLNPVRYRVLMNQIKNKNMSRIQVYLYAKAAKVWLRRMRGRYHFEKSRQVHDELVSRLLQDREAIEVGRQWGVDVEKLVK